MFTQSNIQLFQQSLENHNKKDIIYQSANQFAVIRVVWDPGIVFSCIHSIFQVSVTQTPALWSVILERPNDCMDKFSFETFTISQVHFIIVQSIIQISHWTICQEENRSLQCLPGTDNCKKRIQFQDCQKVAQKVIRLFHMLGNCIQWLFLFQGKAEGF